MKKCTQRSTPPLVSAVLSDIRTPYSKYRNKQTQIDNITFASKREAARYQELLLLERAQEILDLRLQVKYPLVVRLHKVGTYIADFVYKEGGREIVEDAKGVKTAVYRLKKKLMRAIYEIDIRET